MSINFYNQFHRVIRLQKKIINKSNFTYFPIIQELNSILFQSKPLKILDFGCGVGTIAFYTANLGHYVVGVDISNKVINACKRNAIGFNLSKETEFITLKDWKINKFSNYFDLIICTEVIEHLPNDLKIIKSFKQVLKKKGKVLITTPSIEAPLYKMGLLKNFDMEVGHLRRYAIYNLKQMIQKEDFIIEKIYLKEGILRNSLYTIKPLGFFIKFIRGYISNLIMMIDDLLVKVFGGSNIYLIARKKS